MKIELPINLTRDNLIPHLINSYSLQNVIEVGVREGYHAKHLLENTNINLTGIDIKYDERANQLVGQYPGRYTYKVIDSISASKDYEDNYFDLVYVDAGHNYYDSKNDIETWYKKVKPGGILMGDDYLYLINPQEGEYGVVMAIEEFVQNNNLDLFITELGYVDYNTRLNYALEEGKKQEDNLWIGFSKHVNLNPVYLWKRKVHQVTKSPQWIIIK